MSDYLFTSNPPAAAVRDGNFDEEYTVLPEGAAVWKSWSELSGLLATR